MKVSVKWGYHHQPRRLRGTRPCAGPRAGATRALPRVARRQPRHPCAVRHGALHITVGPKRARVGAGLLSRSSRGF